MVSGLLQEGSLFFPAAKGTIEMVTVSPTAIYYGELSSQQEMKRKNKEVKATLESLAGELKKRLKQESVFIVYRELNWCI